jgi:tRNA pseudouridine65 synthase
MPNAGAQPTLLYEADTWVAVHKPSGWFTHRSPLDPQVTAILMHWVRDALGVWVYPVHRLDRPTSGVMVLARSPQAAASLGALFAEGQVRKTYQALVRGWPEALRVDYALSRDPDDCRPGKTPADYPRDLAVTELAPHIRYALPIAFGRYAELRLALIEARPLTGRRHQIRRHLKHAGYPIIGDANHGKGPLNRLLADAYGANRLMLAATRLEFVHHGVNYDLVAPLQDDFAACLERLRTMGVPPTSAF